MANLLEISFLESRSSRGVKIIFFGVCALTKKSAQLTIGATETCAIEMYRREVNAGLHKEKKERERERNNKGHLTGVERWSGSDQ